MKIAIVDSRIPKDAYRALSCYADKIFCLPKFSCVQEPVSAHPDMLIFLAKDSIITSKGYAKENKALFSEISALSGRRILFDENELSPIYPADVKFNCFIASGMLFGLHSALSERVIEWTKENTIPVVNVRQGYAKCSTCVVSEDAVITEDVSIEEAMLEKRIDVLRVASGQVALDGYNCGFIGGASGSDNENVYFCGDISKHPDYIKIRDFCHRHKKECVSLGNSGLYDVGTILFLE